MPLLFDMSWDQLQTYEASNPKPSDFDDFWDRGLAEVESVDPALEYAPSSFRVPFAECFDLYFTGIGGARGPRQAHSTQGVAGTTPRGNHVPRLHRRLDEQARVRRRRVHGGGARLPRSEPVDRCDARRAGSRGAARLNGRSGLLRV